MATNNHAPIAAPDSLELTALAWGSKRLSSVRAEAGERRLGHFPRGRLGLFNAYSIFNFSI